MIALLRRKLLAGLLAGAMLLASVGVASADPRDFTFVNSSGWTIDQLYVSASKVESWGDDILGKDVALPGEAWSISFGGFDAGTCLYDVKVIFSDHDELYAYEFNLCELFTIELGADDVFYYR